MEIRRGSAWPTRRIASVCNVRGPVGAAIIASRAFPVQTEKHWRKLQWTEVREVLRAGFTEWQTLPDGVVTDNELSLGGSPTDPFPSLLTLWLVGLGVRHIFIRPHCPTDQAQVERTHRTPSDFALDEESQANLTALQQALDRERVLHNTLFPCSGQRLSRPPAAGGSPGAPPPAPSLPTTWWSWPL